HQQTTAQLTVKIHQTVPNVCDLVGPDQIAGLIQNTSLRWVKNSQINALAKDRLRFVFQHFFFSSRRRHTRFSRDWSSDVCSSDLAGTDDSPWKTTSPSSSSASSAMTPVTTAAPGRSPWPTS